MSCIKVGQISDTIARKEECLKKTLDLLQSLKPDGDLINSTDK